MWKGECHIGIRIIMSLYLHLYFSRWVRRQKQNFQNHLQVHSSNFVFILFVYNSFLLLHLKYFSSGKCFVCHLSCFWLSYSGSVNLTHWGRVTHITIIGSDNGLPPGRRQAIIWTNAGILLNGPMGTKFSEILIEIYTFSLKKIHLKMSSENGGHFVSASMS